MKNVSYPITLRIAHFREGADTRDSFNEQFVVEHIVNSREEENEVYEGLNHEANITIEKFK